MHIAAICPLLLILLAGVTDSHAHRQTLTFEARVAAQEAIERVYRLHQIGAASDSLDAIPRRLLEAKVRTYLRQSVALDLFWHAPVTAAALERELERISRDTRFPDRLEEVFQALGNDTVLIQETFARAALVDRLTRSFQAQDSTLQAATRERAEEPHSAEYRLPRPSWDAWWSSVEATLDENAVRPVALSYSRLPTSTRLDVTGCTAEDKWVGSLHDDTPSRRNSPSAVWTGRELLVWGGESVSGGVTGERYDPLTDTWRPISTGGAPSRRNLQAAVWTGSEMIVWGGLVSGVPFNEITNTGARYDPQTDSWRPTSLAGAPNPRTGHTAIWTGSEMIIWGGGSRDGARYQPGSDTWVPVSTVGAPLERYGHTAVWTGQEMIVWGGAGQSKSGGRYNPATNGWQPMQEFMAPSGRSGHTAVWTGNLMVVWGGSSATAAGADSTGGRYDPVRDTWLQTNPFRAPEGRYSHTAVMVGGKMIVWGGTRAGNVRMNSGGRYDPILDAWDPMTEVNAPSPRAGHAAAGIDGGMLIWGGIAVFEVLNTGGRYDPIADAWLPTSRLPVPAPGIGQSVVWTGTQLVIWGGDSTVAAGGDGGRYDPLTDAWTAISATGAPSLREFAATVWTGSEMIVWGGFGGGALGDGRRYDPTADEWHQMATVGAPTPRGTNAVWTGREMLVWSGADGLGVVNGGSRYDPQIDSWHDLAQEGAPAPSSGSAMVWTGSELLVWGGETGGGIINSGGRYDPIADAWEPMSAVSAPSARRGTAAIWTGAAMIVWGGVSGSRQPVLLSDGASYDPVGDAWTPLSNEGAPAPREGHGAVWTGDLMLVWGGYGGGAEQFPAEGKRYDPTGDRWLPLSTAGQPPSRKWPTAVWTGAHMIIWGGHGAGGSLIGGIYAGALPSDADGDGVRPCAGDCNDANPMIHPGAVESCDDLDNDCNGLIDDLSGLGQPCGSSVGSCRPGLTECNDGELQCVGGVGPSSEVCNGMDDDCDGAVPPGETDVDADGFLACDSDCNNLDPAVNPRAPELPGNGDDNCDGVRSCDPAASYRSHGEFVQCVSQECARLVSAGLVTTRHCASLVSEAALSDVGTRGHRQLPIRPIAP